VSYPPSKSSKSTRKKELKCKIENLLKKLDYSGITFPVQIKDIKKIENQNSINGNIFGYHGSVYPIRISDGKYNDHMGLLYKLLKDERRDTMSISQISID